MRQFLFRQKIRFDLGCSFLTIVNLGLLVIASGDKIYSITGCATRELVVVLVPVVLICVWLFGFVMDRFGKMVECNNREMNGRNEMLCEMFERVKRIEEELKTKV